MMMMATCVSHNYEDDDACPHGWVAEEQFTFTRVIICLSVHLNMYFWHFELTHYHLMAALLWILSAPEGNARLAFFCFVERNFYYGGYTMCHECQTLFVRLDIWVPGFLLQKWKENVSDQASISPVASLAPAIQQTPQENHHQVHYDREQNGL